MELETKVMTKINEVITKIGKLEKKVLGLNTFTGYYNNEIKKLNDSAQHMEDYSNKLTTEHEFLNLTRQLKQVMNEMNEYNNKNRITLDSRSNVYTLYNDIYSDATSQENLIKNIKKNIREYVNTYNDVTDRLNVLQENYNDLLKIVVPEFTIVSLEDSDLKTKSIIYELIDTAIDDYKGLVYINYQTKIINYLLKIQNNTKINIERNVMLNNQQIISSQTRLNSAIDPTKNLMNIYYIGGDPEKVIQDTYLKNMLDTKELTQISKYIELYNSFLSEMFIQINTYYDYCDGITEITSRYTSYIVYMLKLFISNSLYYDNKYLSFSTCRYYYWIVYTILKNINLKENGYFSLYHYFTLKNMERTLRYYLIAMLEQTDTEIIIDKEKNHNTLFNEKLLKIITSKKSFEIGSDDDAILMIKNAHSKFVNMKNNNIFSILFNNFKLILDNYVSLNYKYSIISDFFYINPQYPIVQEGIRSGNKLFSVLPWIINNNINIWSEPQSFTKVVNTGHHDSALGVIKNIEKDLPYDKFTILFKMYDILGKVMYYDNAKLEVEKKKYLIILDSTGSVKNKELINKPKNEYITVNKKTNLSNLLTYSLDYEYKNNIINFIRVFEWKIKIKNDYKFIKVYIPVTRNYTSDLQTDSDTTIHKLIPEWKSYSTGNTNLNLYNWNEATSFEFVKWITAYITNKEINITNKTKSQFIANITARRKPLIESMFEFRAKCNQTDIDTLLHNTDCVSKIPQSIGDVWFILHYTD
jgi:hypothetical protein